MLMLTYYKSTIPKVTSENVLKYRTSYSNRFKMFHSRHIYIEVYILSLSLQRFLTSQRRKYKRLFLNICLKSQHTRPYYFPFVQLTAEQTLRISPWVPVLSSMLLILTMDFPNSTLKVKPNKPLKPKKRWTNVRVEASVHSFWSDSKIPRPFLKFEKKDVSNLPGLPVSSPTSRLPSPFWGQSACNWLTNAGSMLGSAPFAVKLNSLYLKNWHCATPMVCPPVP